MPTTFYMIDPPSPFSPTGEWEAFLRGMEKLPQDNEQVATAVREAREMLAERAKPDCRCGSDDSSIQM